MLLQQKTNPTNPIHPNCGVLKVRICTGSTDERGFMKVERRPTKRTVLGLRRLPEWLGKIVLAAITATVTALVTIGITSLNRSDPLPMSVKAFWGDFIDEGQITFYVSKPPVYKYCTFEELDLISKKLGKALDLISDSDLAKSAIVRDRFKTGQFPYLVLSKDQYTGVGEAVALADIQRFLVRYVPDLQVSVFRSDINQPIAKSAVILGGWISNAIFDEIVNKNGISPEQFPYRSHDGAIYRASTGSKPEAKVYVPKFKDGILTNDFALITKISGNGSTLILCSGINSQGTEAAGAVIAERNKLGNISKFTAGRASFQILIEVPVGRNGMPELTRIKILDVGGFK